MSMFRILFADDDRLVLATMAQGLRDAGYEVVTAERGEQALAEAQAGTFDLALLDIRMPGLSGIDTARRLREEHGIPAMFFSAYGEHELVNNAIMDGGLGYLMKPIDVGQLIPAVAAALARALDFKSLEAAQSQLEQALAGNRNTSVAIGILMERRRLTAQAAFEALRAAARKDQRKLEDYCGDLVKAAEQLNAV
jgi:two-component system, response regulator PdtaR